MRQGNVKAGRRLQSHRGSLSPPSPHLQWGLLHTHTCLVQVGFWRGSEGRGWIPGFEPVHAEVVGLRLWGRMLLARWTVQQKPVPRGEQGRASVNDRIWACSPGITKGRHLGVSIYVSSVWGLPGPWLAARFETSEHFSFSRGSTGVSGVTSCGKRARADGLGPQMGMCALEKPFLPRWDKGMLDPAWILSS